MLRKRRQALWRPQDLRRRRRKTRLMFWILYAYDTDFTGILRILTLLPSLYTVNISMSILSFASLFW